MCLGRRGMRIIHSTVRLDASKLTWTAYAWGASGSGDEPDGETATPDSEGGR
jgi:hypothetical protein